MFALLIANIKPSANIFVKYDSVHLISVALSARFTQNNGALHFGSMLIPLMQVLAPLP